MIGGFAMMGICSAGITFALVLQVCVCEAVLEEDTVKFPIKENN